MKVLYIDWGYIHDCAIMRAFENVGVEIVKVKVLKEELAESKQRMEEIVDGHVADIVFSVNFWKHLSNVCLEEGIPYCSWILQLPNYDLYQKEVRNLCNYIAVCDSYLTQKLLTQGIEKVFFLPDAIEKISGQHNEPVYRGVCMIEKYPEQVLQTKGMSLYSVGYLEACLHAQRVLSGDYILENVLLDRVLRETTLINTIPEEIEEDNTRIYLADYYLAPTCTALRQSIFLNNYSNIMTIYSDGCFDDCNCERHNMPETAEERDKIYAEKEFTVVMPHYSLHNGIPRQMLEIVAAGGFPLCAMQKDYSYFFKSMENIACFRNFEEFQELLVKYGNNREERERLRVALYNLVTEEHTYKNRINHMIEMWGRY